MSVGGTFKSELTVRGPTGPPSSPQRNKLYAHRRHVGGRLRAYTAAAGIHRYGVRSTLVGVAQTFAAGVAYGQCQFTR